MTVTGVVIWACVMIVFGNIAAFALFIWRARQADDEPTEIGSDYLPADPLHRRDMQDW